MALLITVMCESCNLFIQLCNAYHRKEADLCINKFFNTIKSTYNDY